MGAHLSHHDASDLLEQGRSFARRKPGTFLLGAVVAGVVAGRLTRGAKAHHDRTSPSAGASAEPVGGRHATAGTTEELLPYSESEAVLARTGRAPCRARNRSPPGPPAVSGATAATPPGGPDPPRTAARTTAPWGRSSAASHGEFSTLVRQEIALAKAEATQDAKTAGKGVGFLAGAGVAGHLFLIALSALVVIVLGDAIGYGGRRWS